MAIFPLLFLVFVIGLPATLAVLKARSINRALAYGPARGLILSANLTASPRFSGNEESSTATRAKPLRGERRGVTLEIDIRGNAPYVVQCILNINTPGIISLVPGTALDLAVDPHNPQRIFVLGPGGFTGPWLGNVSLFGPAYAGIAEQVSFIDGPSGMAYDTKITLVVMALLVVLSIMIAVFASFLTGDHKANETTPVEQTQATADTKKPAGKPSEQHVSLVRVEIKNTGLGDKMQTDMFSMIGAFHTCFDQQIDKAARKSESSVTMNVQVAAHGVPAVTIVSHSTSTELSNCVSGIVKAKQFTETGHFTTTVTFASAKNIQQDIKSGNLIESSADFCGKTDFQSLSGPLNALSDSIRPCFQYDTTSSSRGPQALQLRIERGKVTAVSPEAGAYFDANVLNCIQSTYKSAVFPSSMDMIHVRKVFTWTAHRK